MTEEYTKQGNLVAGDDTVQDEVKNAAGSSQILQQDALKNSGDAASPKGILTSTAQIPEAQMLRAKEEIVSKTKSLELGGWPVESSYETVAPQQKNHEQMDSFSASNPLAPWQDIELERVRLNKYIQLGYITEQNLRLVIERLDNIQIFRQKQFNKIIQEMQKDKNSNNSQKYSALIEKNEDGYNFNILFLDFSRYLKSLFHLPTRRILQVADLIYPQGIIMQWAFRRLSIRLNELRQGGEKEKIKQSYEFQTKFDFTVGLLGDLDRCDCSVFFIGGFPELLEKVENIFKTSFSHISLLGRYTARYHKLRRIDEICTVINKSAPTLLLVAKNASIHDFIDGKHGKRKMKSFLVLDYPEALQDFSGKRRKNRLGIMKFFPMILYLLFPWKWPKLFCIILFIFKIFFLTLLGVKNNR